MRRWKDHYARARESLKIRWYMFRKNYLSLAGLIIIISMVVLAVFAPVVAPYPGDVAAVHFDQMNLSPSLEHLMGTDNVGRDIFSRVLFGARISLQLGIFVLLIAIAVGVPLGLIAGYFEGPINAIIMRVTDIFITIPGLLMALVIAALLGPNLINAMLAISFVWWPVYCRLVQGEVLSIKEELFIEAARSLGASRPRIIFKDILPNCIAVIVVKGSLDIGLCILLGASLSFLGLGVQPPTPEWGAMVASGRVLFPSFWWGSFFPGLMLMIAVLGFNLFGDGLRDALEVEL